MSQLAGLKKGFKLLKKKKKNRKKSAKNKQLNSK